MSLPPYIPPTASTFLASLHTSVPPFLSLITHHTPPTLSQTLKILTCDHVCYRTQTLPEYAALTKNLNESNSGFTLLKETIIGGRMICTYHLTNPIICNEEYTISTVEIPAPKTGRFYARGLEHVEFVIGDSNDRPNVVLNDGHQLKLMKFAEEHDGVVWDFKAVDKEVNPDVSTDVVFTGEREGEDGMIPDKCSIKFHLVALEDVVAWENLHGDAQTSRSQPSVTWERDMAKSILREINAISKTNTNNNSPYIITLSGIPGSGKSTSAATLKNELESESVSTVKVKVLVLSLDGYHYKLSDIAHDRDLVYRRGCYESFDVTKFILDINDIKTGSWSTSNEYCINLPVFNHDHGDPEEDVITFVRGVHGVVIVEGLYLLHPSLTEKLNANANASTCVFNHNIFITADMNKSIDRLKVRNKCIPGYTSEEIDVRCEKVDRVNAQVVAGFERFADTVVEGFNH